MTFVDFGQLQFVIQEHKDGARNGCCRERQRVDSRAFFLQIILLRHSEFVLFVNDDKRQISEFHRL